MENGDNECREVPFDIAFRASERLGALALYLAFHNPELDAPVLVSRRMPCLIVPTGESRNALHKNMMQRLDLDRVCRADVWDRQPAS